MGTFKQEEKVSTFHLEGKFVGFVDYFEENPKRLKLATAEGERWIKLSKELRSSLKEILKPGDWLEISGEYKYKYKTGELKLKAYQVNLKASISQPTDLQPPQKTPKTKACVMICQKSSCRKRGADQVCQAVAASLRDHGLEDQVAIKSTGCMNQCKTGPCVVLMPDKSRYTQVSPQEIPTLIEKHFAAKLKPEASEPELCPVT
ncbi:MAG: (2Fe-2S) ferredoxin domain-containing protein [Potamolinea sp.]